MSPRRLLSALAFVLAPPLAAQVENASPGFVLSASTLDTDTVLIDADGAVVHTWPNPNEPGLSTYLLENGNLLRAAEIVPPGGPKLGAGGRVEEIAWDGTVVWSYDFAGSDLQHHDIEPLPNGNVLLVAWEGLSVLDALAAGRNPAYLFGETFCPDQIVEVRPTGPTSGEIVWEWHAWDHLVQDFDPTKPNFGSVPDHPELIDLNYPPQIAFGGDWLHFNSVDYNAELDQIAISVRNFDEIWVIDHSTTTEEAAGHTGGNSGMGGDLLYRWGNPVAYGLGGAADQQLDGQHDAAWVAKGFPGEGNLTVFNNNEGSGGVFEGGFSTVVEIEPPIDGHGTYFRAPGEAFGPAGPVWEYVAEEPTDFFSSIMGGAVRLASGNTLVCSSVQGLLFEVNPAKEVVWGVTGVGQPFKVQRYERYLWTDGDATPSLSAGGQVELDLVAGVKHAGLFYVLLGSTSGTEPGITAGGVTLPLNPLDGYFLLSLTNPVVDPYVGQLNAAGTATATFKLPAGTDPGLAGLIAHHAYGVLNPLTGQVFLASNPEPLLLVP
ncbi:MAG: aryl-sulfate sulfotransferase [Planctomycetota bacterium]